MAERYSNVTVGVAATEDDGSQLLADALKKMDGLIGDFRPASPEQPALSTDPVVLRIVDHCHKLHVLIADLTDRTAAACPSSSSIPFTPPVGLHPCVYVSPHVQESIIAWLGGVNVAQSQQLLQDKDKLLEQVVTLQRELEACQIQNSKLASNMEGLERVCMQKDQQVRDISEELRLAKVSLSTKEVELRHLKDQFQAGYRSEHEPKQVSFAAISSQQPVVHRRSFRKSFKKVFGVKDRPSSKSQGSLHAGPHLPTNPQAMAFCGKNSEELSQWLTSIGMTIYNDLVVEKQVTGERLAEMVAEETNQHLVQLGILSTLHCKKLRLAVEAVMSETPPPMLNELDHVWVGQWMENLGLPQFKQLFLDACYDGRMLNVISLEDLRLLDVTYPFHLASIKRGLQALRMCGYDKDYMKDGVAEKTQGSQKLLHWSAKDVFEWVCSIELEEYAAGLDRTGIHGAVMYLDVQFTSESLARALGISQTKTIIRKHLSRKFMELIGPVAAQSKVDAMQSKSFVCLDPTEPPSNFSRARSRSVSSKRGQRRGSSEQLLLPINSSVTTGASVQYSSARCTTPV